MSPKIRRIWHLALVIAVLFGFTASVAAAPAPAQSSFCSQYYTVRPGDDIFRIASMFGVNWQYLATVNGLSSPYALTIGQSLCIPSGSSSTWTNTTYPYNYNNYYNNYYPYNTTYYNNNYYPYNNNYYYSTVTNPYNYYLPNNCSQTYTVQWGDTLYNIATRYGMNWTYLASTNNLAYPYTLYAGQRLCVSVSGGYYPPNPPTYCRSYYTVQPGQNLFRIGLMYGVSWTYLAWLNNLPNPNAIYAGQSLCVMQ